MKLYIIYSNYDYHGEDQRDICGIFITYGLLEEYMFESSIYTHDVPSMTNEVIEIDCILETNSQVWAVISIENDRECGSYISVKEVFLTLKEAGSSRRRYIKEEDNIKKDYEVVDFRIDDTRILYTAKELKKLETEKLKKEKREEENKLYKEKEDLLRRLKIINHRLDS